MLMNGFIAGLDNLGVFGNQLVKAKLVCYPGSVEGLMTGDPWELEFLINPTSIQMTKQVEFGKDEAAQRTVALKYGQSLPTCLTLGELWFDTYETRKSVREQYIDKLEDLCNYNYETHYPPVVILHYGEFTQGSKHKPDYQFFVEKLDVDYSMFLPDGTPVRAKVALHLVQVIDVMDEERIRAKRSPDHARIYTVKRGDSLQSIARYAFDDPREWRRIADINKIDDLMCLRPGQVLLLPPILR